MRQTISKKVHTSTTQRPLLLVCALLFAPTLVGCLGEPIHIDGSAAVDDPSEDVSEDDSMEQVAELRDRASEAQYALSLPGADVCPGTPVTLKVGKTKRLKGRTKFATNDYESYCGNAAPGSGADVVYAVTLTEPATVTYNLKGSNALNAVMYARETCADPDSVLWCRDFEESSSEAIRRHVDAGTHYIIVDGSAGTEGRYTLRMTADAPTCGDGIVNPGESCDDGNAVNGDGCSTDCTIAGPGLYDTCSTANEQIIAAGQTVLSGSTIGNTHQHTYNSSQCTIGGVQTFAPIDAGAPDAVYHLQPTVDGLMTVSLGYDLAGTLAECVDDFTGLGCWDRALHVRHTAGMSGPAACQDTEDISSPDPDAWVPPSNQIACDVFGAAPEYTQGLSFDVLAGESYYLFVSGYYPGMQYNQGPYNVHLDLTP